MTRHDSLHCFAALVLGVLVALAWCWVVVARELVR